MDSIDCLVIGAGVVGLAVARALARSGREVVVVEAEDAIGTGTSSRNSEVIHAGIYYPTGLAKTRLCVEGRAMLYAFCRDYRVPHRRCGKLIVAATEAEVEKLAALAAQARANGVDDIVWLSGGEARALEPALRAERALLSPSTGIVDSHALMLALRGDAEAHGAMVALGTPVVSGRAEDDGIVVETGGAEPMRLHARLAINAAGLGAQAVARAIEGMPADRIPPLHLAKGNYFSLSVRSPFSRLVYPMPAAGGLGVHLTLDLAGQARIRARRRVDRDDRVRRRSPPRGLLLRGHPNLLAGFAGQRPATGLRGNPPQDRTPGRIVDGLPDPDRERSRDRRPRQPFRNRVAGPDGLSCDRRADRRRPLTRPTPPLPSCGRPIGAAARDPSRPRADSLATRTLLDCVMSQLPATEGRSGS